MPALHSLTLCLAVKEATELSTTPSPDHHAIPLEDNLFEWHFTLRGPPSPSPYANGIYHGRIILPPTYPLQPPSFRFLTPTGRFEVNREICLSISGHHEETWQPAWGIRTALVAIRSFMDSDAKGQLGGMDCTEGTRKAMAQASRAWKCAACMKGNEEILQESEKRTDRTSGERKELEVPEELRLAYRDEMGKQAGSVGPVTGPSSDTTASARSTVATPTADAANTQATPQPSLPQPTRTTPVPDASQAEPSHGVHLPQSRDGQNQRQLHQQQAAQTTQTQPVPAWIDKAIAGVAISLAIMVFRKLVYV